jgi:hypothetical protein
MLKSALKTWGFSDLVEDYGFLFPLKKASCDKVFYNPACQGRLLAYNNKQQQQQQQLIFCAKNLNRQFVKNTFLLPLPFYKRALNLSHFYNAFRQQFILEIFHCFFFRFVLRNFC